MKIVQINATCGAGSTGKICLAISELLAKKGVENYILYASGSSTYPLSICYQGKWYTKLQALFARIFGNYGFGAFLSTKKLLKCLDKIKPDIVHLHNLHSHNCNLEALFSYLKKKRIKVFWTFHDCWAFTGYCMHFDMIGCDKWMTECRACPQKKRYSWFWDKSQSLYRRKKKMFSDMDITVITPSKWLADLAKKSFFKGHAVKVIHNGIDLEVFRPVSSNFREEHGIAKNKKVLLGVAFKWSEKKGLDVFLDLFKRLDAEEYQIVLVGIDDTVDKQLPQGIISIHRTQNQRELAEIYTAADLFVNPTREDTFPTVNLEALACGTPVLTFRTGGSPEMITDACGIVVEKNDVASLENAIIGMLREEKNFTSESCVSQAKLFGQNERYEEYVQSYF